jgi:exosortase H (IPTLxxWG-CTERM-specific)
MAIMPKKTRAERRREKLGKADKPSLTEKVRPFLSLKHPITRFCLLFLVLLVGFSILLSQRPVEKLFSTPFTTIIASQAAWILNVLGMDVYARGISISGEGFSVEILGNCNAIFETMLFLSAIIAFPASIKEKVLGGGLGTIFIYLLNLIRVVVLYLIGVYAPDYFDESHVYVSQTIFIVMVAMFWLLWIGKGVKSIPAQ